MTVRSAAFVLLLSIGPSFAMLERATAGENYAFLVSVKEYDEKELRSLEFSRNDIVDFQKTLVESGFRAENIVLMHDDLRQVENRKYLPEAAKIRQQLKLLLAGLEEGDAVIVALAGHGVQFKGDTQNYFCPVDAKLADRRTLVSLQEIYEELKGCRASRRLLLVDACRNDPQSRLSRSRSTVELESVTRPQKAKVPDGIVALFSCGPGQQSYEHAPLKHGVFFHHVLKAWNGDADGDRDGQVTFDELATFVKRETTTYARRQLDVLQTPHLQSDYGGEWVLRQIAPVQTADTLPSDTRPADPKKPAAGFEKAPLLPADPVRVLRKDLEAAEKDLAAQQEQYNQLLEQNAKGRDVKGEVIKLETLIDNTRQRVQSLKEQLARALNPGNGVEAVRAELAKAQAELAVTELEYKRAEQLDKVGAISPKELAEAAVRRLTARGAVAEIQKRLDALEAKAK